MGDTIIIIAVLLISAVIFTFVGFVIRKKIAEAYGINDIKEIIGGAHFG